MRDTKLLLSTLLLVAGCSARAPSGAASGTPTGGSGATGDPGDPLAQPPSLSTLTDVSSDLDAILESGALTGACDRYHAGDASERLRCGKEMFFYETFGTGGVPTALVQFLVGNFPANVGGGFAELGMIPDPTSTTNLPLGLAPTVAKLGGSVDALAFTCASCHFARLPDGRYAVGAPNHAYQYGTQILQLILMPALALGGSTSGHDPAAIAAVQPLIDALAADSSLKTQLLTTLLPLAGLQMPALTVADEHHYASWLTGTMDFLIAPLPVDDQVHTVSKISALWSIPTAAEAPDAQLGWTGATHSVADFLTGFVLIGGGATADWDADALGPLADYVASLRAPANPSPPDAAAVERGRLAFFADGCAGCHGGPRGMGPRLYEFAEIGTDDALAMWAMTGIPAGAGFTPTGKLKSPRLVGTWASSRFLHNGALPSLESLFCVTPRPTATPPDTAMGAAGHDMTCAVSDGDKADLMAYLRAR